MTHLVRGMLKADPNLRPTIRDIHGHPKVQEAINRVSSNNYSIKDFLQQDMTEVNGTSMDATIDKSGETITVNAAT